MDALNLDKAVRKVTLVTPNPSGTPSARALHSEAPKKKKKKVSKQFKGEEKEIRRFVQAIQDGAEEYLRLHDRSSRKKRNGWMNDAPKNLEKVHQKVLDVLFP